MSEESKNQDKKTYLKYNRTKKENVSEIEKNEKIKSDSYIPNLKEKKNNSNLELLNNQRFKYKKQEHSDISIGNEGVGGDDVKLKITYQNNEKESIPYSKTKEILESKNYSESNNLSVKYIADYQEKFNELENESKMKKKKDENIFEQFLVMQSIFRKDRDKLRPSYVPKNLPHREREINQIASILVTALKGGRPSNVFIYGKTGTGKTAVVKYLEKEMQKLNIETTMNILEQNSKDREDISTINIEFQKTENEKKISDSKKIENGRNVDLQDEVYNKMEDKIERNWNIKPIYINCKIVDTQYGVLANIGNRFIEKFNERIPFTGWPTDKVYEELKNRIIKNGGVITIILDEIDKLVTKSGDEVLYLLSRINSELEESGNGKTKVSLIGISNYLKLMDLLDPRVKSSLGEEEIIFHPYNAAQLENILKQRAYIAFEEGVLASGVIQMCASFAAQEHGDARKALELLRIAGELAEREKSPMVLEKYVRKAQYKIELNRVNEVIRTLPTHSKIVLLGIILSEEKGKRKLMTGEVYDIYKELCRRTKLSNLTHRRVADLISELDMLGIISALLISKGRYGRTREIQLSVPMVETKKVLEEDELLKSISTHKLRLQTRL